MITALIGIILLLLGFATGVMFALYKMCELYDLGGEELLGEVIKQATNGANGNKVNYDVICNKISELRNKVK